MSDLRDNTLPTTPSPAAEQVDATSAQNTFDPVTATTPPQTEVKLDQSVPTIDPLPVTPPNPLPESTPEPVPPTPSIAITPTMGDDTPLAFASSPNTTPPITDSSNSSDIPTAPGATTSTPVPEQPKQKSKVGKILMGIFAFLMLGGAVFGGYWYYVNNFSTTPQIAVLDQSCYDRCRETKGHQVCTCNCGGACTRPDSGSPTPEPVGGVKTCSGGTCTCSGNYTYCGGAIDKCIPTAEIAAAGGGCNTYGEVVYGIPTVYGANYSKPVNGACAVKKCTCGTTDICFDKTGYCDQKDANAQGLSGSNYNQMGLCAVAGSYSSDGPNAVFTPTDPTLTPTEYSCTDAQCTAIGAGCTTIRYTCSGTVAGNSCSNTSSAFISQTPPANSTGFAGKCGTVEQLDVMCNGVYMASRTRINPPCQPGESAPPITTTPTMACTGLTRSPNTASPAIGDTLTFTCTGTVTPASAGTLSYKFRYKIGSGAVTPLTNKTTTTAELTLAACGTYTVECQACATLNGVLKCDPQWVGATQ